MTRGAGVVLGFLLAGCRPASTTPESDSALTPFGCWHVGGEMRDAHTRLVPWPQSELCIQEDRWLRRSLEKRYEQFHPPRPFDVMESFDGAITRWTRTTEGGESVWRSDPVPVDWGAFCEIEPAHCDDARLELRHRDGQWQLVANEHAFASSQEPALAHLPLSRLDGARSAALERRLAAATSIESLCQAANSCARALQALPPADAASPDGEQRHVPRRADYLHFRSCLSILSPGFERRVQPEACRVEAPPFWRCVENHSPDIFGNGPARVTPCFEPVETPDAGG